MRILKWDVPVDDQPHMIGAGEIVSVACQYGALSVQVWTAEPDDAGVRDSREALVVGTGQHVEPGWKPVGTAVTSGGALVWHVVMREELT